MYPQHCTGWQSLATELSRDTGDNYPARRLVSILCYSPPFLTLSPHNLECWVQAGIQDCESHIMCYGSQGTRCNVTSPSPGFIKCRKAETCWIFPLSWKNVFFSLHCHRADVLETWDLGNDSGQLPDTLCVLHPPSFIFSLLINLIKSWHAILAFKSNFTFYHFIDIYLIWFWWESLSSAQNHATSFSRNN